MTTTHTKPTAEQLAALVGRLNQSRADNYHEWVQAGMAIHDADSGDFGFQLFDQFSRQSPKYNEKSVRAKWKSFRPGGVTVGTLIHLANDDSPISKTANTTTTKRPYMGLAEYAAAHYAPAEAFRLAGWREAHHDGRPALMYPTATGNRWRFTDGQKPTYDSPSGYRRCWYRLAEAIELARLGSGPLILVNGEASTIAGQHHGYGAVAVAGGTEKPSIPADLLTELRSAWQGDIIVALDSDKDGWIAAPQLAEQLQASGFNARAVNLGGSWGFDFADFCALHNGSTITALQALPTLTRTDTPTETPVAEKPPRFTIRTLGDLASVQPPRWLIHEEIVAGAFNLIYGASGSGKTFYAIDRALRVAAAGKRVLYVATEDLAGLKIRVSAWRVANPQADVTGFTWLGMEEGLDLSDNRQVDDLVSAVNGLGFDLITLDTLREAHTGDENSSQDMAAVNRAIQRLIRETGAALDVVHHSGVNDGRERGSTALAANCDLKLKVSNDDGVVVVSCEKLRNGSPFLARNYRISQVTLTDSQTPVGVLRPTSQMTMRDAPLTQGQRKILEVLDLSIFASNGAKASQISDAAGVPVSSLYRALSSLYKRGHISQGAKGDPYTITQLGRSALAPELIEQPIQPAPVNSQNTTPQQDAQFSLLSTNSHGSHENKTSTLPIPTTRRVGMDESPEREERELGATIQTTIPETWPHWPTVREYIRADNLPGLYDHCVQWGVDKYSVLEGAEARWPNMDIGSSIYMDDSIAFVPVLSEFDQLTAEYERLRGEPCLGYLPEDLDQLRSTVAALQRNRQGVAQ